MKRLYFILFLLIPTISYSQDSLQNSFDQFILKLKQYESSLDSTVMIPYNPCENYLLKWEEFIVNGTIVDIQYHTNRSTLCLNSKRDNLQSKKKSKKRNASLYSDWYCDYQSIGDKYVIVIAEAPTSSINQKIYYYEKIE